MQKNIPEKNAQIRKMAMIYQRAERVCVWLGNEDKSDSRAIEFIDRLLNLEDFDPLTQDPGTPAEWAALNKLMQRSWFNRRWIVQEISLARSATLFCGNQTVSWQNFSSAVALFVARYRDLRHLFQSSAEFHNHPNYLGEVEALGAKALVDITTNLFRKTEDGFILERLFSLEALISTMTLFECSSPHDTIYSVLWLAHDAQPDSKDFSAMSFLANVRTPTQSPDLEGAASTDDEIDLPMLSAEPDPITPTSRRGSEVNFNQQSGPMSHSRSRNGLLSLPRSETHRHASRSATDQSLKEAETQFDVEQPHSVMVDYNQDTFQVFRQFLDFTIGRSLSLDIICHPWAPEPSPKAPKLPSWIPQLSCAPFEKEPGTNAYSRVRADSLVGTPGYATRPYNASGKIKMYPVKDFIQGRTLVATGFPLDKIKATNTPAVDGIIPYTWMDFVDWSGPPEPVPDRFWRTLVADRSGGAQKHPPAYFPLACKWVFEQRSRRANINTTKLLTHGKCPSIVTEFLRRVQCVVWGRMLALTEGVGGSKPLLALVPAEAEDGDLLCILHGCSVPVVLRREKKRRARSSTNIRRKSSRTTPTSSIDALQISGDAPQISLTTPSATPIQEQESVDDSSRSTTGLTIPAQTTDTAYASTGVRKIFDPGPLQAEPSQLPFLLESKHRYKFIGECYVHGMMSGEAFKHRMDHRIARRAFHLI